MKARIAGSWRDDVLEYHREPDEYRLQVELWQSLGRIRGLYFERPRSPRLVLNYLREFGFRQVALKVLSRSSERGRNEKHVAWGIARIVEGPDDGALRVGETVAFLAPAHPECAERICLPAGLLCRLDPAPSLDPGTLRRLAPAEESDRWWAPLAGWSRHSGAPLPDVPRDRLLAHARAAAAAPTAERVPAASPPLPRRGAAPRGDGRKSAVLFGYGNYAKTAILPGIGRSLQVRRVHEIDPSQIPAGGSDAWVWDASPEPDPSDDERYDAYLIAGYHHTHAPLARTALERGAYAVVEKPVVTDRPQLARLVDAVRRSPRFFACFHRRYSPLNRLALEDLGVAPGERVDYHCIVSEVVLPPLHWYRWPSSRSRIVSNGCHWIDHFLQLNGWAPVVASDLFLAPDGTLNCSAVLANGAVFSMLLTERGSERIGLSDHVELRSRDVTVRIQDSARYVAEGPDRVLRRTTSNRFLDHARMYRAIGEAIAAGGPGDPPESLERSAGLTLDLEDRLRALAPR